MKRILHRGCFALALPALATLQFSGLCLVGAAPAAHAAPLPSGAGGGWRIYSAETRIEFHAGVLEALGLEVVSDLGRLPAGEALRLTAYDPLGIAFAAPHGAFARFVSGELRHHGGFTLRWKGGAAHFPDAVLRPLAGPRSGRFGADVSLDLLDGGGRPLLYLDHVHTQLFAAEDRLELRWMDLRLSAELARLMGQPEAAGVALAVAHVVTDARVQGRQEVAPKGVCAFPDFNSPVDIELTGINSVQQTARESGRVAITTSTSLQNVGQGEVEWYPPFGGQHPYLVWSLYRISGGRIEQLGQSPLKHAFYTVNVGCDCGGGNILWVGCGDTYGVATNESRNWLGPRDELESSTGLWEECGSHFDATPIDCDRDHGAFGHASNLDHRLAVAESELETAGARYLFDSWYLVKDDVDIFNTMGYREIAPTFNGSLWTFPFLSGMSHGSVLDAWVDPAAPDPGTLSSTMTSSGGHLQLAVRTTNLGAGVWRYEYALLNLDFDPRISVFSVPLEQGTTVAATAFRDLDDDGANDWQVTVRSAEVEWAAPPGNPGLDWGTLYNFTLEAARAPVATTAGVVVAETGSSLLGPATLAPGVSVTIFADGFESGDTTRWSNGQ